MRGSESVEECRFFPTISCPHLFLPLSLFSRRTCVLLLSLLQLRLHPLHTLAWSRACTGQRSFFVGALSPFVSGHVSHRALSHGPYVGGHSRNVRLLVLPPYILVPYFISPRVLSSPAFRPPYLPLSAYLGLVLFAGCSTCEVSAAPSRRRGIRSTRPL